MSSVVNMCTRLAGFIRTSPTKRYLRYIASPQWAARRRDHLARCNHWCEICHQRPAVQVHHWTYEHLGDEPPCDLCAVCVQCHWRIHRSVMVPVAANDNKQEQFIFTFDERAQAKSS